MTGLLTIVTRDCDLSAHLALHLGGRGQLEARVRVRAVGARGAEARQVVDAEHAADVAVPGMKIQLGEPINKPVNWPVYICCRLSSFVISRSESKQASWNKDVWKSTRIFGRHCRADMARRARVRNRMRPRGFVKNMT